MNNITISEINIYPIKSLKGISLKTSKVEKRGLQYDRRWMLIDENFKFISQRQYPSLSLLNVEIIEEEKGLKVNYHSLGTLFIPFKLADDAIKTEVKIWEDTCEAYIVGDYANKWFTQYLKKKCKLVYMPDSTNRFADKKFDKNNNIVSFADGFPILLTNQESLNDLNSKMENSIPMNRFRPNIVISGTKPYEEDKWKKFSVNDISFNVVKPCIRCVVTTTDQDTGIVNGKEPLKTLSKYHTWNNKVIFGQNLTVNKEGFINIKDKVNIIG